MIYLHRTLLFLLVISLLFPSCKSAKEVSTGNYASLPADSLLLKFEQNQIPFEWFSAKARVNYKDKSISKGFTASIRMRRDSVIWISVTTMMGIEAARLLIRNDSVFFIDRINDTYHQDSISYLQQYIPFPFSVSMLQKILVGNAMLDLPDNAKIKEEKGGYSVLYENSKYKYAVNIDSDNLSISTEHLTDIQSDRSISLVSGDYQSGHERLFSYGRTISIKANGQIKLSLKFSKVNWDEPFTFPFRVKER